MVCVKLWWIVNSVFTKMALFLLGTCVDHNQCECNVGYKLSQSNKSICISINNYECRCGENDEPGQCDCATETTDKELNTDPAEENNVIDTEMTDQQIIPDTTKENDELVRIITKQQTTTDTTKENGEIVTETTDSQQKLNTDSTEKNNEILDCATCYSFSDREYDDDPDQSSISIILTLSILVIIILIMSFLAYIAWIRYNSGHYYTGIEGESDKPVSREDFFVV